MEIGSLKIAGELVTEVLGMSFALHNTVFNKNCVHDLVWSRFCVFKFQSISIRSRF